MVSFRDVASVFSSCLRNEREGLVYIPTSFHQPCRGPSRDLVGVVCGLPRNFGWLRQTLFEKWVFMFALTDIFRIGLKRLFRVTAVSQTRDSREGDFGQFLATMGKQSSICLLTSMKKSLKGRLFC